MNEVYIILIFNWFKVFKIGTSKHGHYGKGMFALWYGYACIMVRVCLHYGKVMLALWYGYVCIMVRVCLHYGKGTLALW